MLVLQASSRVLLPSPAHLGLPLFEPPANVLEILRKALAFQRIRLPSVEDEADKEALGRIMCEEIAAHGPLPERGSLLDRCLRIG